MEEVVKKASKIGLDFIIFGGMTLKEGKQKDYFLIVSRKVGYFDIDIPVSSTASISS